MGQSHLLSSFPVQSVRFFYILKYEELVITTDTPLMSARYLVTDRNDAKQLVILEAFSTYSGASFIIVGNQRYWHG